MSREELLALTSDGNESGNGVIRHDSTAGVVVVHRFTIQGRAKPGSRIDLCCEICEHRIVLGPKSIEKIAAGGRRFCRECMAEGLGISVEDFPPGDR